LGSRRSIAEFAVQAAELVEFFAKLTGTPSSCFREIAQNLQKFAVQTAGHPAKVGGEPGDAPSPS
jgi:hypothetical protein